MCICIHTLPLLSTILFIKCPLTGLLKPQKCQNLQFLQWPLEAGSKNESVPIVSRILSLGEGLSSTDSSSEFFSFKVKPLGDIKLLDKRAQEEQARGKCLLN